MSVNVYEAKSGSYRLRLRKIDLSNSKKCGKLHIRVMCKKEPNSFRFKIFLAFLPPNPLPLLPIFHIFFSLTLNPPSIKKT